MLYIILILLQYPHSHQWVGIASAVPSSSWPEEVAATTARQHSHCSIYGVHRVFCSTATAASGSGQAVGFVSQGERRHAAAKKVHEKHYAAHPRMHSAKTRYRAPQPRTSLLPVDDCRRPLLLHLPFAPALALSSLLCRCAVVDDCFPNIWLFEDGCCAISTAAAPPAFRAVHAGPSDAAYCAGLAITQQPPPALSPPLSYSITLPAIADEPLLLEHDFLPHGAPGCRAEGRRACRGRRPDCPRNDGTLSAGTEHEADERAQLSLSAVTIIVTGAARLQQSASRSRRECASLIQVTAQYTTGSPGSPGCAVFPVQEPAHLSLTDACAMGEPWLTG
jgi:hypothetical protein